MPDKAIILIAEDNLVNLKILTSVLSREHYAVREATNGEMALHSAQSSPPDIILLDISMPEMDGFTVCEHLKADPSTRDIPIIFISGLSDTENVVKAFEVGGVDYISKPFKAREVLARVESQLMLLRHRRETEARNERDRRYFERITTMRRQFIGTVTHDLKNPLSTINGHTFLLQRNPTLANDQAAQSSLQRINRAASKIKLLITDMLDLMEIESKADRAMKPVLLSELLREDYRDFLMKAEMKSIRLTLSQLPEIHVHVDVQRMGRALDNLLSNAIKYTPKGGTVTLRGSLRGNECVIEVQDTGLGIPEQDIPHLFTAFHRVQTPLHMAEEGTGLGLSIVKAIVEQHGGRIEVESAVQKGSTFRIILPVHPPLS